MVSAKPDPALRAASTKRTSADIVLMALFASLGIATKNLIQPLIATITGPLYVPTGAVAGGLYMMWPIIAYGLTRKIGTATLISLTQAFFSLLIPIGNFGAFTFIIYLAPGLAIDGFFWATRHKACCAACCIGAAALANVAGTLSVGALVMFLPAFALVFFGLIAAVSGCVGGFVASVVLVKTRKIYPKGGK